MNKLVLLLLLLPAIGKAQARIEVQNYSSAWIKVRQYTDARTERWWVVPPNSVLQYMRPNTLYLLHDIELRYSSTKDSVLSDTAFMSRNRDGWAFLDMPAPDVTAAGTFVLQVKRFMDEKGYAEWACMFLPIR